MKSARISPQAVRQEGDERAQANRTQHLAELTMLVKRWRLSSQSRNFTKK